MPCRLRTLALCVSLVSALAACGTRPIRGEEGSPKAVVLCAADDDARSVRVARALNDHGYEVIRKSTTIPRERSSAAVYAVRADPERVDAVTRLLHDELSLDIDVLPFQQHATGGNAVVIWLGTGSDSK